ncbi:hypothetical protein [Flavobacterium tructae]|uniref:RHS repeat-associated core domain-containing protein n=1 Tax=Flavobacterium tructae TaxID=1114873 RepID=A0A1S1J970_9FLAO|nr:hypothetical protein [Flavobacterium tructae]OHT46049.1 hypothetical protein BHE19_00610 [Flavobacterium tructae]OXB22007.1 hypothetical protein B0A71_00635 [Flavobacterium tructae]
MNKLTRNFIPLFLLLFFISGLTTNSSLYAQGPNAPEASGFEPVDATDMVSLLTGDMTYVVPLLNVPSPEGGYPIALSYHAGIAVDQEASWVGLGWVLNPGTINRNVNGYPDDWKDGLVREFAYDEGGSAYSSAISIGYGVPGEWSVGVGVSWGSNRSLGGSVSASVGGIYGSVGTDGVSVGVGLNDNLGVSASVGYSGSFGIGADIGMGEDSYLNLGIGYGPGGVNGNIGLSEKGRGKDGKLIKGVSSGVGISLSSSGMSVNSRIQGFGTSASVAFNSSTKASDYNVLHENTSFTLTTPFGYFSYGKNTIRWSLLNITDFTMDGSIYAYDPSGEISTDFNYENGDVKVSYEAHNDTFEVDTESSFEQSSKDIYIKSNNGVFSNLDNYNVTAQGIGGSIAPQFLNNVRMVPFGVTAKGDNFSGLAVGYAYGSQTHNLPNSFKKIKPIQFNFCNSFNSYLNVIPFDMSYIQGQGLNFTYSSPPAPLANDYSYSQDQSLIYHRSSYKEAENRKRNGQYIEYFTVGEINSGVAASKGFLDSENNFQRDQTSCGYDSGDAFIKRNFDSGIGGFKITSTDGKTYHYSIAVYQAEQIRRLYGIVDNKTENQAHMDRMHVTPYATHWLLTAITGPDYIKNDVNRKYPDEGDYGYWVRFDYGKWSDGYIWKTPIKSVNIFNKVKEYNWGRKQVYYLDKIKTRSHTAFFIKNLREDNKSSAMIYKNMYHYRTSSTNYMNIPSNPLLKLEKIILLKNEDANSINKNRGIPLTNVQNYNYYLSGQYSRTWSPTSFYLRKYSVNNSGNVFDTNDFAGLNIEGKALKIITFNHDYNLAKGATNSSIGKLTLNSVNFKGKQGIGVIPPIKFNYAYNYNFDLARKNDFGYYENVPQAWSLDKITTPTGGNINIIYEPDSYDKVAIKNGRVFTSKLKFTFLTEPPHGSGDDEGSMKNAPKGITRIKIEIDYQDPTTSGLRLADYFDPSKPFFMDMWYSAMYNNRGAGYDRSSVNIDKANATIVELNTSLNYMIIDVMASSPAFRDTFQHSAEPVSALNAGNQYSGVENANLPRFELAWNGSSGGRQYSMRHTIIGNKINPNNNSGIRVKQITVDDNTGKTYNTYYNYNNPFTGKTSGIIPYYPEPNYAVNQQAPYISLLPGPVVTYAYVTESSNEIKKQYKFKVLEEIVQTNNLISFGDLLQINTSEQNPLSNVFLKNVTVKNNMQALGRIEEIKVLNTKDQIVQQTKNNYKTVTDYFSLGQYQQSYYAVKHISTWGNNAYEQNFYNVSSMIDVNTNLQSITTNQNGYTNTTYFDQYDPITGQATETRIVSSDGKSYKTKIIPAYLKYPEMGSKVDNLANKNMLSQTAVNYSYINDGGTWKETGVGITTWSNIWSYQDIAGTSVNVLASAPVDQKIWRIHKTYVWNGIKDVNGIFTNYNSTTGSKDDNFDWAIGVGQPSQWKQISEITLYNHFSSPLEMKDINGNYASTKMGDNDTKVTIVGNAGYNEMFFSGAENNPSANFPTYLEPEITITNASRNSVYFHTGKQSVAATSSSLFGTAMKNGQHRPGKYKISVWVEKTNASKARINNNGVIVDFTETYNAGNWVLKSGYVTVPTSAYSINVTSLDTSTVYFDDLMIRPIYSSTTGYVYNEWDELTYIIGNNGLATKFEYDAGGRLIKTSTEVIDDLANGVTGGFKAVKTNVYNNKYLN